MSRYNVRYQFKRKTTDRLWTSGNSYVSASNENEAVSKVEKDVLKRYAEFTLFEVKNA